MAEIDTDISRSASGDTFIGVGNITSCRIPTYVGLLGGSFAATRCVEARESVIDDYNAGI